jgi:hypothetical protein
LLEAPLFEWAIEQVSQQVADGLANKPHTAGIRHEPVDGPVAPFQPSWLIERSIFPKRPHFKKVCLMRTSLLRGAFSALALSVAASAAEAKCTRLGFSVNDYGKQGPTDDAKSLLDKYIAKWAADNGVKNYTTGKKDVKCELFLDVGLFDEHTCRAEASVCWGDSKAPAAAKKAADAPATAAPAATAPAAAKPKS